VTVEDRTNDRCDRVGSVVHQNRDGLLVGVTGNSDPMSDAPRQLGSFAIGLRLTATGNRDSIGTL